MREEDFKSITDSIQEKIGKEASGIIADDIGKILTLSSQGINTINNKDKEIQSLKDTNEKLVIANGNLLQQIPMASDYDKHQSKEEVKEEKKSFSLRSAFDSKGNFKK